MGASKDRIAGGPEQQRLTDALEQVRKRLDARPRAAGERSDAPEVDLALRRLNAEVRQMLSLRDLVRQNQSLLLQG